MSAILRTFTCISLLTTDSLFCSAFHLGLNLPYSTVTHLLPPVRHPLSARTEAPHCRLRRLNPSLLPIPLEKVFEKIVWILRMFFEKSEKVGKKVLKFFFSPALLNICMNDYFRLFTRLRRIRVKKKVFVEYLQ